MKIISHRGYWKETKEKNTVTAFKRSFLLNFGTETDVRDYIGNLVISHDIPDSTCIAVYEFFSLYKQFDSYPHTLALNIKADGLQNELYKLIKAFDIHEYFVFDMSVPDILEYIKRGIKFYSRQSEYEKIPAFYDSCAGIWLDAFYKTWYSNRLILEHLHEKKNVAIVSPELHQREHLTLWEQLKKEGLHHAERILLCTDFPEEAAAFFQ